MKKWIFYCGCAFICALTIPLPAATQKYQNKTNGEHIMTDINRLKNNCASVLHKKYADHSQVKSHLASQSPDGSWKDIDHQDQNRSNWAPAKHLLRLRLMAAAWSNPASQLYHNAALGNGIKNGHKSSFGENRAPRYAAPYWIRILRIRRGLRLRLRSQRYQDTARPCGCSHCRWSW